MTDQIQLVLRSDGTVSVNGEVSDTLELNSRWEGRYTVALGWEMRLGDGPWIALTDEDSPSDA